jgi:hypothetical protein
VSVFDDTFSGNRVRFGDPVIFTLQTGLTNARTQDCRSFVRLAAE